VGNEPVALHLRDEPPNPRTELDAFGVELNLRPELAAAGLVVERFALDVLLEVAERVAERSARRRASRVRSLRRNGTRRELERRLRFRYLHRVRRLIRIRGGLVLAGAALRRIRLGAPPARA